ncbi:MAG: hypothetical protein WC615_16430 [Mucilaginibacter sp.]|jgi:hypothetical protein|uniref:hypothetical protein n=1 Tax=Mucilaginibacter sp. TaxID=1882438 RepID=UPI0035679EE2
MNRLRSFRFIIVFTLVSASLFSCTQKQPFDRDGWNDGDGITFPRRYMMVDDLLATHKLVGLKFSNVVGLLHYPDRFSYDSLSFHYEITRKMSGIDTLYTKNLVFTMGKDKVITSVKVTERDYKDEKKK